MHLFSVLFLGGFIGGGGGGARSPLGRSLAGGGEGRKLSALNHSPFVKMEKL